MILSGHYRVHPVPAAQARRALRASHEASPFRFRPHPSSRFDLKQEKGLDRPSGQYPQDACPERDFWSQTSRLAKLS